MVSALSVEVVMGKSRWVALRATPKVTAVAHMVQFLARVETELPDQLGECRCEGGHRGGQRLRDDRGRCAPVSVRAGRDVTQEDGCVAVLEGRRTRQCGQVDEAGHAIASREAGQGPLRSKVVPDSALEGVLVHARAHKLRAEVK